MRILPGLVPKQFILRCDAVATVIYFECIHVWMRIWHFVTLKRVKTTHEFFLFPNDERKTKNSQPRMNLLSSSRSISEAVDPMLSCQSQRLAKTAAANTFEREKSMYVWIKHWKFPRREPVLKQKENMIVCKRNVRISNTNDQATFRIKTTKVLSWNAQSNSSPTKQMAFHSLHELEGCFFLSSSTTEGGSVSTKKETKTQTEWIDFPPAWNAVWIRLDTNITINIFSANRLYAWVTARRNVRRTLCLRRWWDANGKENFDGLDCNAERGHDFGSLKRSINYNNECEY